MSPHKIQRPTHHRLSTHDLRLEGTVAQSVDLQAVPDTTLEPEVDKRESRTDMHRVPAHTIVGCPVQIMAEVSGAAEVSGTVRFFDQFGLLGAAGIDDESGVATLPYAFTFGGRREIWAVYTGSDILTASRAATCTLQVYGGDRTLTGDIHEGIAR